MKKLSKFLSLFIVTVLVLSSICNFCLCFAENKTYFSREYGMTVSEFGDRIVAWNLKTCVYTYGNTVYLRDLSTENTFLIKKGVMRAANAYESEKMSQDVWNLTGIDIRRKGLILSDIQTGVNYGVCSEWFQMPAGSRFGGGPENEKSSAVLSKDDEDDVVPTPPSNPIDNPEVPIIDPIVE